MKVGWWEIHEGGGGGGGGRFMKVGVVEDS